MGASLLFTVDSSDHIWIYANEMTFGESLNSFRKEAGHAIKTNYVIKDLGLWAEWYQPYLWGGDGGYRLSSATWTII